MLKYDKWGTIFDSSTGKMMSVYKRKFAETPPATNNLLMILIEDNPKITIRYIRDLVNYDKELVGILDKYISAGFGDVIAEDVFGV